MFYAFYLLCIGEIMLSTICGIAKAAISSPIVRTLGGAAVTYAANKLFNDSSLNYSSCDNTSSSQKNEYYNTTYNNVNHNHYYTNHDTMNNKCSNDSSVLSNDNSARKHHNVFMHEFCKWNDAGFTFTNTIRLSLKYTIKYYDDINNGCEPIEMKPLITMKNQ